MEEKKKTVLVLTRDKIKGFSAIQALGRAGYTVDVVSVAKDEGDSDWLKRSRYVRKLAEAVSPRLNSGEHEEFVAALTEMGKTYDEKAVLIPVDDSTALAAYQNREELEKYYIMPTTNGEKGSTIKNLLSLINQDRLADRARLSMAKTWVFPLSRRIRIPKDMEYPCRVRPAKTVSEFRHETTVCADKDELFRTLTEMKGRASERHAIVQPAFDLDCMVNVPAVCFGDDITIGGCLIRPKSTINSDDSDDDDEGYTSFDEVKFNGKTVRVPSDGGIYADPSALGPVKGEIERMLRLMHYRGIVNVKFEVQDERMVFFSMQMSPGRASYVCTEKGCNLYDIYVKKLMGEEVSEERSGGSADGSIFLDEDAMWKHRMRGLLSGSDVSQIVGACDMTLLAGNSDDSAAAEARLKMYRSQTRKRAVKRFLRRLKFNLIVRPGRALKPHVLRYPQVSRKNREAWAKNDKKVIIVGRNYGTNLGITRSMGQAGYDVEILRLFQQRPRKKNLLRSMKPDAYSKYVKVYHSVVSHRKDQVLVDKLIELADPNQKKLLLTSDDVVADTVDLYYNELSKYYYLQNINGTEGAIDRMMDKSIQKKLAREAGINVADSRIIRVDRGIFEVPDDVKYPCFVKPNMSRRGTKTKMRRCDNREELFEALDNFPKSRIVDVLVEEFIDIDHEYSVLGVSTKEKTIGPAYFVAEEGGTEAHRGIAVLGRVLSTDEDQEMIDRLVNFVHSLGYTGIYDIDLAKDKNGKMYFLEINFRFGGSGYAFSECGANLPAMYADYVFNGTPLDENLKATGAGRMFTSEKILLDEYYRARIDKDLVKKCIKTADIRFIKNEKDMRPYRHFKRYFLFGRIGQLYYSLAAKRSEMAVDDENGDSESGN
jgi:predicted ATP-grasp superfamily ATP-dependent carboligase